MAEPVANALNSLANSETKDFPAFPKGTLKMFFQCTASAWIKLRVVEKQFELYGPQVKAGSALGTWCGSLMNQPHSLGEGCLGQ